MSEETRMREDICRLALSLFERGLTHGSTGNISARLSDGSLLVTPTGSSMGFLDPERISHVSAEGNLLSGDKPTKEMPLHSAFYDTRSSTGAVVHLHSCHATAVSMLPDLDPSNALPPLTPYSIMQLGKVRLLPFFLPGDPAMGAAVRGLAGRHSAVLLAHHGPVVAGRTLESAVFAMEELEATARLALLLRGTGATMLDKDQVAKVVQAFDVDWPD